MVMGKNVRGVEGCGTACAKQAGCTAFDVRPDGSGCLLYGHSSVVPASGVPGDCYMPPLHAPEQGSEKKTGGASKKKAYKVPEFDAPTVEADDVDSEDDDEWLFEPPPPVIR